MDIRELTTRNITRSSDANLVALVASYLVTLAMIVVLALSAVQIATPAYAKIYSESEAAAAIDESASADTLQDQEGAQSEAIEDEDVPMSSGLGGAEPVSNMGVGFQAIIIAGIVAVVAFFVVSVLRLNRNISTMKNRFH